jgi:hypothetical protein
MNTLRAPLIAVCLALALAVTLATNASAHAGAHFAPHFNSCVSASVPFGENGYAANGDSSIITTVYWRRQVDYLGAWCGHYQAVTFAYNRSYTTENLNDFVIEFDDANGATVPGSRYEWFSAPGQTFAEGASWYFYGPSFVLPDCHAWYRAFGFQSENWSPYPGDGDYAGGYSGSFQDLYCP